MIPGLRCASDSDIKATIAKMNEHLDEAKKEGDEYRIDSYQETIQQLKTLLQIYNN